MPDTEQAPKRDVFDYQRLKEHMIDPTFPGVTVVHILTNAKDDETLNESIRRECAAWLDRLVDEEGNPKDDLGRDLITAAGQENALARQGTFTSTQRRTDRDVLTFQISHRARKLGADNVRKLLQEHFAKVIEEIIEFLFDETDTAPEAQAVVADITLNGEPYERQIGDWITYEEIEHQAGKRNPTICVLLLRDGKTIIESIMRPGQHVAAEDGLCITAMVTGNA
jgi:histone H3/H4